MTGDMSISLSRVQLNYRGKLNKISIYRNVGLYVFNMKKFNSHCKGKAQQFRTIHVTEYQDYQFVCL